MHWSNDYNTRRAIDNIPRDELLGHVLGAYELNILRSAISQYLGESLRVYDTESVDRWSYLQDMLIKASEYREFNDEGKDCDYD